jgi:hypothetical protein
MSSLLRIYHRPGLGGGEQGPHPELETFVVGVRNDKYYMWEIDRFRLQGSYIEEVVRFYSEWDQIAVEIALENAGVVLSVKWFDLW